MATQNIVTVNFIPCKPDPVGGYKVLWRVAGSGTAYVNAGNFFISPAVFYDVDNPEGTEYEGVIRSDCGSAIGANQDWSTLDSGGGGSGSGSGGAVGNPITGAVDNDQGALCGALLENLWLDELHFIIQPGAILYYDEALTMPVTGFDFVIDSGGNIYFLNSLNSHVGSPTGYSC